MCLCSVTLDMCDSFADPRTVAHQAPLSMDFPGRNTGVDCHFLLQGIFLTQGSYLCFLHWQVDSLPLSHQGSPQLITYLSCILLSSGNTKIKEALSLSSRCLQSSERQVWKHIITTELDKFYIVEIHMRQDKYKQKQRGPEAILAHDAFYITLCFSVVL